MKVPTRIGPPCEVGGSVQQAGRDNCPTGELAGKPPPDASHQPDFSQHRAQLTEWAGLACVGYPIGPGDRPWRPGGRV